LAISRSVVLRTRSVPDKSLRKSKHLFCVQ